MLVFGRRTFLTAAIAAGLPTGARAAADPAVLAPVRALIETLLTIMKQGKTEPFASRAATLAPVIDRSFDLDAILRASVGAGFSGLEPDKLEVLRAAFRDYTVASYVRSFDHFTGQRFDVQPDTRAVTNGEQVVMTKIVAADGDAHELDYVMHNQGGAWRVIDVLADGSVSRVAVQRSDFRRQLSDGGVAALIASLQAKAKDLATL
jgi:phospholipid transport system substrate-binding protein